MEIFKTKTNAIKLQMWGRKPEVQKDKSLLPTENIR